MRGGVVCGCVIGRDVVVLWWWGVWSLPVACVWVEMW